MENISNAPHIFLYIIKQQKLVGIVLLHKLLHYFRGGINLFTNVTRDSVFFCLISQISVKTNDLYLFNKILIIANKHRYYLITEYRY